MRACCSMLLKQHVAAVLSAYVCLSGRESEGKGADVDVKEQSMHKRKVGVTNEGNAWQEADKDINGERKKEI